MTKLKPCPFCNQEPNCDTKGSCIEISCYCGASLSLQKSDYLTIEERRNFDDKKCIYPPHIEKILMGIAASIWNERPGENRMLEIATELYELAIHGTPKPKHNCANPYAMCNYLCKQYAIESEKISKIGLFLQKENDEAKDA